MVNKSHILVVDDDNRIRDLIKEYLKSNDYIISTAIYVRFYQTLI